MCHDRLAPHASEVRVVVVPPPRAIGETDQVLVHARAAGSEELLQIDAVRAVGLARQEVALHCACELARRLAVLRLDDAVDDERPVEREPVPTAPDDGEVVRTHGVVRRPAEERDEDGQRECREATQADAPAPGKEQDERHEQEEHLADRSNEDENGNTEAERGASAVRRALDHARREQRSESKRGCEDRIAREPMEEECIARVDEQHSGDGDTGRGAEPSSRAPPAEDGERVQKRHRNLCGNRTERENALPEQAGDRRSPERRLREDDLARPQLERCAQVGPEVSALGKREGDGDQRVHAERKKRRARGLLLGRSRNVRADATRA